MIQFIADGLIIPIVLLGIVAVLIWTARPKFERYLYGLMAGMTSLLAAKLLSVAYQPAQERPFELLGQHAGALYLNNPGFPSDHALFVTAITLAVFALTKRTKLAIVLAGLSLLVCVGRVLALVHTPLDIVGGVAAGLIGGLWYLAMPKRLR